MTRAQYHKRRASTRAERLFVDAPSPKNACSPVQPPRSWRQLLVQGMTPELAARLMGVTAGVAECELRQAAVRQDVETRWDEMMGQFLASNWPFAENRRPQLA